MFPLRKVLYLLIASYVIVLFSLWAMTGKNQYEAKQNLSTVLRMTTSDETFTKEVPTKKIITKEPIVNEVIEEENNYKFSNPSLANYILSQLDVYNPLSDASLNEFKMTPNFTKGVFLGFKPNNDYCDLHREHFVNNPASVFNEINVIIARPKHTFMVSEVIPGIANNIHPHNYRGMSSKKEFNATDEIKPEVNSYFSAIAMFNKLHIGKQYSCISQMSNHIPGSYKLSRKASVAEAAKKYVNDYKDRSHCMNNDKYFPDSFLLNYKQQCEEFFKILNSAEYKDLREERRIVYIKKIPGVHRGEGVTPMNLELENEIRAKYENGKLCGRVTDWVILQHYIHNPLLLNGNKFDFRMYMLVASTNPLIAFYHDGFLRVSLINYDVNSDDKKVLLTNLALSQQLYDDAENGTLFKGMDPEQLRIAQQWSFERLQAYLLETGVIHDPNWLDNYLRPEFKKAMIHLIRLSFDKYFKHSSLYELFGVDFMLDTNLNLWFIEANDGPAFDGYSKPMAKFIIKMLRDHFEVMSGLLRSRMKRVVKFVNKIIEDGDFKVSKTGQVEVRWLEQQRETFDEITKNYFEKEFEPSLGNGFSKIIDENFRGVDMYQGFIAEDCL